MSWGYNFDVTMGSAYGAETSELIGAYLLNKISHLIPKQQIGLYRDDGLAVVQYYVSKEYCWFSLSKFKQIDKVYSAVFFMRNFPA